MTEDRIHRTASADGTLIAGHVHGHGPPLVLVHGSLEDGDLCWGAMLPHLDQYTCYLPSTRSRGLSGHSDDLSPQRRREDITAFIESIGEPVLLFGESDGGALALGAAAHTDAVAAVAAYEPTVFEVADDDLQAALGDTLREVTDAVTDGRPADAARIFSELVGNDDEVAALDAAGYLDQAGHYMPICLQELEQEARSSEPGPTHPSHLADISVPTLALNGSRSALRGWFRDGVRHIADHVDGSRVRELEGPGHFAVTFQPEPVADELSRFFGP